MKSRTEKLMPQIFVIVVALLVLVGLIWVNYKFASNNPGGNDFLAHYIGTRALIYDGISPYSDEVALDIQKQVFGRPAEQGEIEHRVVYPLYSVLVFAPFALIKDYATARVAWMTFLELALLFTAYFTLQITRWKPSLFILGVYYLFSVLWYHAFRSIVNGNAVIVVTLFFTAALYAIFKGRDNAAGVLLALSTIKPNLVVLAIIFVLFWSLNKGRKQLFIWFAGSLLVLVLGGLVVIPDWIIQNIWEILKYPAYNPPGSIGEVIGLWFPEKETIIRLGIAIALGILFIYESWTSRKGEYSRFLWTVFLILLITQCIGINTDPGNFTILFGPFILILAEFEKRWATQAQIFIPVALAVVFFGLWILFVVTLEQSYQPMQSPIMFFPFPGLVLIGLYWIKWWVDKSATLILTEDQ